MKETGNGFQWSKTAPYAVLIISGILLVTIFALSQGIIGEKATNHAPSFSQEDIDGQIVSLEALRGKPVVLDFFATWCVPCGPVTDNLGKVWQEFGDSIVILSISIDPIETEAELKAYRTSHNVSWPFLIDKSNLQESYDVTLIPKVVIVDQDGKIAFAKDGSRSDLSAEKISSVIEEILDEKSNSAKIISRSSIISIALLAGVVSFFSPCAFPLLPGFLSYTVGHSEEMLSQQNLREKLRKASLVGGTSSLGLLVFLLSFGMVLVLLGASLLRLVPFLGPFVGLVLIISGILLLSSYTLDMNWVFRGLERLKGDSNDFSRLEGPYGVFLYGIGYGAAAMGCTAPIFFALIFSAFVEGGVGMALLALGLFALAMSSLLIGAAAIAAFTQDTLLNQLKAPSAWLKKASGLILVLVGIYLILYFLWSV